MALALAMSKVTTPIFMGIVYFLVLTPTVPGHRLLGYDPLRKSDTGFRYFWMPRARRGAGGSDLRRQF
jgi:hypothetical protein